MTGEGADVLGQGEEPLGPPRLPPWVSRVAVAAAVVLALLGLNRSGLLSADEPAPRPSTSGSPGAAAARLVARVGDRLFLAARGDPQRGAALPGGLRSDARLVPVRVAAALSPSQDPDGAGPLLGVHNGLLFQVDASGARWRPIGRADAVVSASITRGRAVVARGPGLQEVEVDAGRLTDKDPFPGYDSARWHPEGVLAATGTGALVMSRPASGGLSALALAWPSGLSRTSVKAEVEELGTYGPLLGIADDWILTLQPGCPGTDCRLRVVSVTRDLVSARDIAPPAGWTFMPGPSAGRTHEALVAVAHLTGGVPDGGRALARLVPGGDNALLVRGTARVRLDAGLVDGPAGSVSLLTDPTGSGDPQVRVWDPTRPAAARLTPARSTFPTGARLVCVCG